tara:strand:+ start:274050 stop:274664 length:615 start_codon:yes stop_codon:yes gene_type:complete
MLKFKLLLLTLLFSSIQAYAVERTAHDVVETSAQRVLLTIKENRNSYDDNSDALMVKVRELLEPVVAFDSISYSVMGKYKKQVSPEQKERFAKVFKDVMVALYAKALVTFESDSVVVLPAEDDVNTGKKAQVVMNVTGVDGSVYKLIYSMRRNKDGEWQARNMIVDGINLGLTYLNQFDSSMNRYEGDVDRVIDSWQDDMTKDQ